MKAKLERSGAGEIILFIHGAGGNANSWLYQTKGLKSQCEVIAVDLPGHGMASVGKGCTSIKEYRDSIQDTLSSSGIDKCFMVGHSMGGAIAMSFAMTFPDTVKGIVLVSTGAKLKVFPQILEGLMKDKENTLNSIIEHAISKNAPDTLKMGYFEEMMKCSPEVIYGDFLACDRFNAMGTLNTINLPTLIICGTEDVLTPPKYSIYLQENIKGSRLVLIKDAGHMVMMEKPGEVNNAIIGFVNSI
ncbi:MAG TPA: alpha/beta hydrolase [Syntrophorhabdaceae bacterium]|jgi:pimeloyl-ACP methyl ester carboxylesterase|nr:alpha/beta hydrolase [Syntrophorhabdaceae bacterium]MDI9560707.1 alpha/beta hydrolase [Pseudomonadota bacterium]MBV6505502.1 hypothetical protein [Syntrophorhabdaceae bacterium]HNQ63924.1 alpha/beta hydrolase [Syntrophorhabdaceae bacterium]HNZ59335.1 alpha/beta hydrolase [Syntrophorhabdaceae bacterium]